MTAGIHVEDRRLASAELLPLVTVAVPTKNAVRAFDLGLVIGPRNLGCRKPIDVAERIEERLPTADFASAV